MIADLTFRRPMKKKWWQFWIADQVLDLKVGEIIFIGDRELALESIMISDGVHLGFSNPMSWRL